MTIQMAIGANFRRMPYLVYLKGHIDCVTWISISLNDIHIIRSILWTTAMRYAPYSSSKFTPWILLILLDLFTLILIAFIKYRPGNMILMCIAIKKHGIECGIAVNIITRKRTCIFLNTAFGFLDISFAIEGIISNNGYFTLAGFVFEKVGFLPLHGVYRETGNMDRTSKESGIAAINVIYFVWLDGDKLSFV
ncbi:hypothetical protein ACJX0J_010003 [Zea mays]